ncbi:hypothetical protein NL108_005326 [Boleophthalmus pectinirostris]|nr:hypothetical protein NL108_005326 [Boleophthalmus pectinirostris]
MMNFLPVLFHVERPSHYKDLNHKPDQQICDLTGTRQAGPGQVQGRSRAGPGQVQGRTGPGQVQGNMSVSGVSVWVCGLINDQDQLTDGRSRLSMRLTEVVLHRALKKVNAGQK